MLRRACVLAALAVMLGASLGMAGDDVKTKTWTINCDTVHQVVYTSPISVTGYRDFALRIEWASGLDTANLNTHQWVVQTEADDGVTHWRNAYVDDTVTTGDADSTNYPIHLTWDGYADSITLDRLRLRFWSDVDSLAMGGKGAAGADSTHSTPAVLKATLTATKR